MASVRQHPGPHRLDSEPLLFKQPEDRDQDAEEGGTGCDGSAGRRPGLTSNARCDPNLITGSKRGMSLKDWEALLVKQTEDRTKISLPRQSSWEKMVFRRRPWGDGETGGPSGAHPLSPAPAGDATAGTGMLPGEGCGAAAAPRRLDRDQDAEEGGTGCDGSAGRRPGLSSNARCDPNPITGSKRGTSLKGSGAAATNGHKRAHWHLDAPRRDTWSGDGGRPSGPSCVPAPVPGGSLQRERLTQGRTGVVKLARTEPARREAWSIFPRGRDPRVRTEKGEGHRFEYKPCTRDWCDACSRQVIAQALTCQNCSYTCHLECESQVQLDCNRKDREPEETPSPRRRCSSAAPQHKQKEAKEEDERGTRDLSVEEVWTRIEKYNAQVSANGMTLALDGSYTGFIKVHLRLSRPVTVPAVEVAESEEASRQTAGCTQAPSEGQEGTACGQSEKRTSFYLPCDSVKQLHISSLTTTTEVIQALLKRFMVLDNPRKFALYRQTHRDGQDLFQKLPLCERPLLLRLIAGPDPEQLSFVLKENETGEVEWHAFSVPELQNFLIILGKEEMERIRAVLQKYAVYRQKLQRALQQHDP